MKSEDFVDLEPCPFCCGSAYQDSEESGHEFWVACVRCGARTDKYATEKGAVEAWNRRGK